MDRVWKRFWRSKQKKQEIKEVEGDFDDTWSNLPAEILYLIFYHLNDLQDLLNTSLVCKNWYSVAWSFQSKLDLSFIKDTNRADTALKQISRLCPRIESLTMYAASDEGLSEVMKCERLRSLKLIRCNTVADEAFSKFTALVNLRTLSLYRCLSVGDNALTFIKNISSLECLSLTGCKSITDTGLHSIGQMTGLQKLDLDGCTQITDQGLLSLSSLVNLQKLNLSWCCKITTPSFQSLAPLINLQHLNVRWNYLVNDEAMFYFKSFSHLTHLKLSGCEQITAAGFRQIASLEHLQFLDISDVPTINDEVLGIISESAYVPQLQHLFVKYCLQVTEQAFIHLLERIPDLLSLGMSACLQFTGECIETIANIDSLFFLDFSGCLFYDNAVRNLAKMTKLSVLDASQCPRITDRTLEVLASIPSLQKLSISGCKRISPISLNYLGTVCPQLELIQVSDWPEPDEYCR